MKTFVRFAVALLAITVVCQAMAEDYYWIAGNQSASSAGGEKAAPQPQSTCCDQTCGGCEQSCCPDVSPGCEGCSSWGLVGFAGFDSFKGISDGSYQSNFGAVTGINSGMPLFGLQENGFGWQLGMSYGVYDWDGRYLNYNRAESQQQIFVTTGFYRKAKCDQRLSFGLVYDWMLNNNWGIYATTPTLGQWRGQIEYAVSNSNSFGMFGALRDRYADSTVTMEAGDATVRTRGVSQANFFWHHKFCESNADARLWVGGTQDDRLSGDKSLYGFVVGASFEMPVTDRLALYGTAQYVHPTASAGVDASNEQSYDVGMGLVWYFGGRARSQSIYGKCSTPYMSVANNATFLVDQSVTQ